MANPLAGDIKVPVIGNMPKAAVFGGLAVTGYLIYRSRSKASSSSTSSTADPYPSDGTIGNPSDPNSVDPATGVTYGDEQVGYVGNQVPPGIQNAGDAFPWDGTYNNPNDPYSMDTSTGLTYGDEGTGGSGGGGGGGGTNGPPFSTNQQWASYAEQQLASATDPGKLAQALGLYLAGQPVDTTQEGLIYEAQGVAGMPPVTGTNGNPPGINVKGSKGGGGGKADNPVQNLKVTSQGSTGVDISWDASNNATSYSLSGYPNIEMTGATSARIRDLGISGHPKSATISVKANPAKSGQPIASIKVTAK